MSESTGEKTEKPSAKKYKDAREKGQVARSQDVLAAAGLLFVTAALARTTEGTLGRISTRMSDGLSHFADGARATITTGDLTSLVMRDLGVFGLAVAPVLATAALVAVAGNLAQTGWVFAPQKLTIDFTRLSPANGLQRLKPSQSGLDLIKTLIAATVIGVLGYGIGREVLIDSPRYAWMAPEQAAIEGGRRLVGMLYQIGFALLAIAGADYGLQKWRHIQGLKMTKQEVRDEGKSSEGNPEIKGRVRQIQREMAKKRMLGNVKNATVVITNPTHFAVAIEYRRSTMSAPVVVAKGKDLLAQRIKQLAREKGVPMVENVPLAQALYREADVGQSIPADLFGAVAEVLAYLVRLKQVTL
ncbi:MAG TPA: EscU/YscU/HrcU family type III secretion system export apparatus switch protein [Vicinamibacterales bacterium]|nr:EscU/YscU/HrcU family type III secretion system export apparatus switch protein [Vicinamibacterales bacterium]